jgi:exodeoxyribonuclease VII large subunit
MEPSAEHVYTPSELNREIKLHLEAGFPRLLLEAEISNLARPASGHLYFSLKDSKSQIRCAMFRSSAARLTVTVENGMQVLARGRISVYEPRGDYQFIVDRLDDAGEGLLQRKFEALKKQLESEGLFDRAHKRMIPAYPSRIGLITSGSGAAVKDLLHVLERRWPIAEILIYPVPVQGRDAPGKICKALSAANNHQWAEVLIAGRGGGSLEDLAAFNDESVARAVFASAIPVVSAVGHETDFSISDFVADLRAPTPSAAAELVTPDQTALKTAFMKSGRQLAMRIQARLESESQKLDHASHRLHQKHPSAELARYKERLQLQFSLLDRGARLRLNEHSRQLNLLSGRLNASRPDRILAVFRDRLLAAKKSMDHGITTAVQNRKERLSSLVRTLQAVSPLETIGRGYAVITRADTGEVISTTSGAKPGDRIFARVSDGKLGCTVNEIEQ